MRMELQISQRSARNWHAKMVYISTDYVFDGQGTDTMAAGLQGLQAA